MSKLIIVSILLLSSVLLASNDLEVGIASTDITPPVGTPLAGFGGMKRRPKYLMDFFNREPYAHFFKPTNGIKGPIRSKTMAIRTGDKMIAFISVDAVGITLDVYKYLRERIKDYGFDEVIISATHTHAGPGALSELKLWQLLATDRFHPDVYYPFTEGIIDSAIMARLTLKPATLSKLSFKVPDVQRNRAKREGHFDDKANLLLAKDLDGNYLGGLVHFGIHGTSLGSSNLEFSADVPGGIERHLEKALLIAQPSSVKPTMLFINAALGDVTPKHRGVEGIKKTGETFAKYLLNNIDNQLPVKPIWSSKSAKLRLPMGRVNPYKCGAGKIANFNIPIFGKNTLPRKAQLWTIKLGDITMMSWPGEPTVDVGNMSIELAKKHGYKDPWVLGTTNGHMGYFVTRDEYEVGGYQVCVNLHGKKAAEKILKSFDGLLDEPSVNLH